jgi:hypothetical protein
MMLFRSRPAAPPSVAAAPGASRTAFQEYRIRITYSNVSKTRFDAWVVASSIDDALAITRKKYPTAASVEYLGESRSIPETDVRHEQQQRSR